VIVYGSKSGAAVCAVIRTAETPSIKTNPADQILRQPRTI
jgi:hypothetical protein